MTKDIYIVAKVSDIKRIITFKNNIDIYYKIDNEITLTFSIIREIIKKKATYKLISYIDIEFAIQNKFLKWYTNLNDFEGNIFIGERKDIFNRISFMKNVYLKFSDDDFILDIENKWFELLEILNRININKIPYDSYFKINNAHIKWTPELLMGCLVETLKYLGIRFRIEYQKITWWYLNYTLTTKIVSFGWIGADICYKPSTTINCKKANSDFRYTKRTNNIIVGSIEDPINCINLINKIDKYSKFQILDNFGNLDYITITIEELKKLNGRQVYYPDNCWLNDEEKAKYKNKGYLVFSDKPDFKNICTRLETRFNSDVKRTMIELGYKKIIIGYFSYKDMYVHPTERGSVSSWSFSNPFVLDLESGIVTYEILRNNTILPYPKAKVKDDKLFVKAPINIPSLHSYGYIIDL